MKVVLGSQSGLAPYPIELLMLIPKKSMVISKSFRILLNTTFESKPASFLGVDPKCLRIGSFYATGIFHPVSFFFSPKFSSGYSQARKFR